MNSGMLLPHAACRMAVLRQFLHPQKVPSALPATTGEPIKVAVYPSILLLSTHLLPSVPKTGTGLQPSVNVHLRPPLLPRRLPLVIQGMAMEEMDTTMGMTMDKGVIGTGVKKMAMAMTVAIITSDLLMAKLVLLLFAPQVLMPVRSWV